MMHESTRNVSALIKEIRACLEVGDQEAARFLRAGLVERDRLETTWFSEEELELLASY